MMPRTFSCLSSTQILTEEEKIGIYEVKGPPLGTVYQQDSCFNFMLISSSFSVFNAHCPISQKLPFKELRFDASKTPEVKLPTGRERHRRRLYCNILKMSNYYLFKYSPYEECMAVAYSAGNKGGQNPSETFITEA